jgi:nucleoside-diphosphate kinase
MLSKIRFNPKSVAASPKFVQTKNVGKFSSKAVPAVHVASRSYSYVNHAPLEGNNNRSNSLFTPILATALVAATVSYEYNNEENNSWKNDFLSKFATFASEKAPIYGIPGTNKERSFIAIKPDGIHRGYIGEVISRFEEKGYKLVAIKIVVPSKDFAEKHYSDLSKKPFFPSLVSYFSSGPVVAMVWEGKDVISGGRSLIGATNPQQATPGTIRGDYAITIGRNMIHGSDSTESAKNEISLWFTEKDVADFDHVLDKWVHETK